jgi:putative ATPase
MPSEESLELFAPAPGGETDPRAPLPDRMRPRHLDEVVGQDALAGPHGVLRALAASGDLPSLILWGPPGSGKTTLARLLAEASGSRLEALSAVTAGVKEIREAVERARRERRAGRRTVLLLDEIHRLNRAQQDALLPHVEQGVVTLIGATTENPSFEVNAPLLSRCRVHVLERLSPAALATLVRRAAADRERGLGASGTLVSPEAVAAIADLADGDARRALLLLEAAASLVVSPPPQAGEAGAQRAAGERSRTVGLEAVRQAAGSRLLVHDRDREEHYNVVSALIKSLRASDPDAALYWAARMLEAGEDPRFVARRLVIFAAEDVGNAEPQALPLAVAAYEAAERIGMPEARIPLAQAVTFLACAPKSNAAYLGIERAREAVARHGSLPVPMHLRNAPTGLLRALGYGEGYEYPHDAPDAFVATPNLPDELAAARFYEPGDRGAERAIAERLARWRARRAARERGGGG